MAQIVEFLTLRGIVKNRLRIGGYVGTEHRSYRLLTLNTSIRPKPENNAQTYNHQDSNSFTGERQGSERTAQRL